MKRRLTAPFALALLVCLAACASTASTQPINKKYANQLSQLSPSTTLQNFREVMPEAVVAGQNTVEGMRVDAYEVTHNYMYDQWYGLTREEKLWFYFYNERLVKWGPPGAWPERADLIVETRGR